MQACADSADEFHARGVAALQAGRNAEAVEALERAVELAPVPGFLANLAEAHRRVGDARTGAAHARRAVELAPDHRIALINLGCCLQALEDYAGALEAFERAVTAGSADARALAYRADALRELGQVRAAIAGYRQAIDLDPSLAHAHANLGPLLLAVGRADEALTHCRRATELAPDSADALLNLGRCLFGLDRLDEAMDAYAEAYERLPRSATLCCNIGEAWQTSGDALQAALWFDKALALDPERVETRIRIAGLKIDQGAAAESIADLQAIIAVNPLEVQAHALLAHAHWEEGDATEAVASYGKAVALRPEFAHLHSAMGQVLASAGDLDAAISAYRKALDINPESVGALYGLAVTLGARTEPEVVARIEALLAGERIRDGARAMLHNALAHYFDATGLYIAAARQAGEANRLQWQYKSQRGWNYDPAQQSARIDRIIATFTREFFARTRGWGLDDAAPVFIVGMPRSGTTLTEQILASHPKVLGVGERTFAMRAFDECTHEDDSGVLMLPDADTVLRAATRHREQLAALVDRSGRDPARIVRIVDKMPDNYSLLGWIATLFPRARIIHCRRDLRDVAVSCWITHFGKVQWACKPEHIASRMRDYRRIMLHWCSVLPAPIFEMDYEALVADQEATSRRLVAWLELEWDPRCLDFHRSDRLVRTASVTQVRQPLYARSVARWRRYDVALAPLFEAIDGLDAGS